MSFGFFIVAALDLLGALETATTAEEREGWINWIYTCQVPFTGGFRGFTGTMLGGVRSQYNWHWDSANLPNTYFALATLIMLGDDLSRARRNECMKWVRSLQRKNGSFGEYLGEDHAIEGGDDPRLCMCAVGTLKLLQGAESDIEKHAIDQVRLQEYISNCQVRWAISQFFIY
jgi:geranylgeranyl transferase type-1 subunit beta